MDLLSSTKFIRNKISNENNDVSKIGDLMGLPTRLEVCNNTEVVTDGDESMLLIISKHALILKTKKTI